MLHKIIDNKGWDIIQIVSTKTASTIAVTIGELVHKITLTESTLILRVITTMEQIHPLSSEQLLVRL
jgi:hypothetical protein